MLQTIKTEEISEEKIEPQVCHNTGNAGALFLDTRQCFKCI